MDDGALNDAIIIIVAAVIKDVVNVSGHDGDFSNKNEKKSHRTWDSCSLENYRWEFYCLFFQSSIQ